MTHPQAGGRTPSDDPTGPPSRRATVLKWLRPGADGRVPVLGGLPIQQAFAIVRTSGSSVAALFVTSLLGFVFWWVAARAFSPGDVGFAAAAIAAMALLARLAALGIGTVLAGELAARRTRPASLLIPALATAATIALALGIAFAAVAPLIAPALGALASNPLIAVGFGIAVALTATGFVLDQAAVGLLRGGIQLLRNVAFAVGKLVVVAAAAAAGLAGGLTITTAWVAGEVIALAALLAVIPRPILGRSTADWGILREMRGEAAAHHVLNLARFAPSLAMPVIVAAMFSAEVNAVFYVAFLLAAAVQPIASSTTFTLYAVARRNPEDLARQIRLTLALSLARGHSLDRHPVAVRGSSPWAVRRRICGRVVDAPAAAGAPGPAADRQGSLDRARSHQGNGRAGRSVDDPGDGRGDRRRRRGRMGRRARRPGGRLAHCGRSDGDPSGSVGNSQR